MKSANSRRKFIKQSAIAATGLILPSGIYGKGFAPSDKLNVAIVGAGGRGASLINSIMESGMCNLVTICDVDMERAVGTIKNYPKAKIYTDFRRMLDKKHKKIDAVVVATPDHTHAAVALPAMELGKHVYVEKPLTHNIKEARMLTEAAAKYKVASQMGNMGSSGEDAKRTMDWLFSGIIGEVHTVHAWTNRPIWPQGVPTPTEAMDVPSTLDWDLWLGPAKMRDFNKAYLPFKWRGFWDFGTGALGDMACHTIDTAFQALDLGHPISAEASVAQVYLSDFVESDFTGSCPPASTVHINFPARGNRPPVKMIWYDGGMKPPWPEELPVDQPLGGWDGGVIYEGSKGKLMTDVYSANPRILDKELMARAVEMEKTTPRVPEGHFTNWVNACTSGSPSNMPFSLAGPLTETVLMGNLAVRSHELKVLKEGKKVGDWAPYAYPGRTKLLWDGDAMRVTNFDLANQYVGREYRKGWEL